DLAALPRVDEKVAAKVGRLADELASLRRLAATGADAVALLRHVRDVTGLGTAMTMLDSTGAEGSSHLDDLDALVEVAALHPDPADLERWVLDALRRADPPPAVTCSTVHRVKGLEWPYVAVAGVADGLLPHRLADDEEEERRILHVAITRSRQATVVLADRSRPSPFVAELDGSAPHDRPAGHDRAGAPGPGGVAGRLGAAAAPAGRAGAGTAGAGAKAAPKAAMGPYVAGVPGLQVTLAGGYAGTVVAVGADGVAVDVGAGAKVHAKWGEKVRVAAGDATLLAPAEAALRSWRTDRAKRDGVAPFIVFHDATLRAIAAAGPTSLEQLRGVSGVGPTKLDLYGDEVLEALAGAADVALPSTGG
ncbi:MAG TPA: HRDC domain-containing protein, partial [Acidimicrobiales bacterium]|nr:HRDC domain-containing protein [Acidimicrobiales bacterium]